MISQQGTRRRARPREGAGRVQPHLIALGDFNIDRYNDPLWQAFASTGLGAPKELEDVPRNIAAAGGGKKKHYDQIAWFTKGNREQLTLAYKTAGYVPWTDFIMRDARDDRARKAHISDHYPVGGVRTGLERSAVGMVLCSALRGG